MTRFEAWLMRWGRKPWSKGDQLKKELADAYVAHRMLAYREKESGVAAVRKTIKLRRIV